MEAESIKDILLDLGFSPKTDGSYYRMRPIYRSSDNNSSLRVHKEKGNFCDFGTQNLKGPLSLLVKITLGLTSVEEAEKWLSKKNLNVFENFSEKPRPSISKTQPLDILNSLLPIHDFYTNKGISLDTIQLFKSGLCKEKPMAGRYVFPIFDKYKSVLGYSGRALFESNLKWKHKGTKENWIYPLFLNEDFIKSSRKIFLVESIGDILALWEAGIKNVICLFGLHLSKGMKKELIKLNPNKIIISLNNEPENQYTGNKAAHFLKKQLDLIFDIGVVEIKLPTKKDFGEMTTEEILEWLKEK